MKHTYLLSDIISFFALVVAFFALVWNIIRDLIVDKLDVIFTVTVGQEHPIEGTRGESVFADAGTFDGAIPNPEWCFYAVNKSRRHIFLSQVEGKYKKAPVVDKSPFFIIALRGLPKKLEPYEVFSSVTPIKETTLKQIKEDNIESMWIQDTVGKKWYLSHKALKRLKLTANEVSQAF